MLAPVRALLTFCLLATLLGCPEPTPPVEPPPAAPAPANSADKQAVSAPAAEPAAVPPLAPVPVTRALPHRAAPREGCASRHEQTLDRPALRAIALHFDGSPALVTLEDQGRMLALWRWSGGSFQRGPQLSLEQKAVRGSALCKGARCELALLDEAAHLLALHVEPGRFGKPRMLASRVDRRMAPALAYAGQQLIYAYTASVDEAMHTFWIARSGDAATPARDLTPTGHGAAAATFVLGAKTPTLVVVDAHAGLSPLLELSFGDSGAPSEARVRMPVSQPYEPPRLAAFEWDNGEVEVAYTAVGRLAMTAVGRVSLRKPSEPTALSPSKGYGELAFAVARSHKRVLFALEVPLDGKPEAQRELVLKLLSASSTHDTLRFAAGARDPSLVAMHGAGEYMLAYSHGDSIHAVVLGCAD